jgi:hypothetical protein
MRVNVTLGPDMRSPLDGIGSPFGPSGRPGWVAPGSAWTSVFSDNRYYRKQGGILPATSVLATTRSSPIILPDAAGVYQSLGNDTLPRTDRGLYANGQVTNGIRNPRAEGATVGVVGSGGVVPTNWTVNGRSTTVTVAEVGTEFGLPYIDLYFIGNTGAAGGGLLVDFEPTASQIVAAAGEVWTTSVFFRWLSAPSGPVSPPVISQIFRDSSNAALLTSEQEFSAAAFVRADVVATAPASTAKITSRLRVPVGSDSVIDARMRVYAPQTVRSNFACPPVLPPVGTPGASTLLASDIRAVQGTRPSNGQNEPFPGWEAAGLNDGLTVLLDFENRMQQGSPRTAVSLTNASNDVVAILNTSSAGTSFLLTAGGGSDTFPGSQTGGRSRAACRVMPDGAFAMTQEGQGSVITGTKASPISLVSTARLTIGNGPALNQPWNDWIYELQVCKPLSDAELLAWVNA